MGALQLTYEPKFKIVHRTHELMRSHEANVVQLWLSIDPLAEKYYNVSPYVYVVNNPVFFIDPDGMQVDTDYKVIKKGDDKGKIVRADPNDGSEKNETDRILETDKDGNIQTTTEKKSNGEKTTVAKVSIDNIAKGIITEGMNMRTEPQLIPFGGKGQPTLDNLVDFLVQFSEKVINTEITGFEGISFDNNQNLLLIEPYLNNDWESNRSKVLGYNELHNSIAGSIFIKAHFHTHPSNTGKAGNIDYPSEDDWNGERERSKRSFGKRLPHYIYNMNGRLIYK